MEIYAKYVKLYLRSVSVRRSYSCRVEPFLFVHLNICNSTSKSGTATKCTRNIDINIPNTNMNSVFFFFFVEVFFPSHSLPIRGLAKCSAIQTEFYVFFAQTEIHLIHTTECPFVLFLFFFLFRFAYLHANKKDMKEGMRQRIFGTGYHDSSACIHMTCVMCTHCAKYDVYFFVWDIANK